MIVRALSFASIVTLIVVGIVALARPASRVILGKTVGITSAGAGNIVELMWAYAHPSDGRHLMACGMISVPQDNIMAGYVYSSGDNGKTWRRTMLENSTRFVSEENCLYGENHRAYFTAGASNFFNGQPHHESGHLHVFTSADDGFTWQRAYTRAKGWMDWTYLAEIPATSGFPRNLVVLANAGTDRLGHWLPSRPVAIASNDDGRTFSDLVPSVNGRHYQYMWIGGTVVLPNGTTLLSGTVGVGQAYANEKKAQKTLSPQVDIFAYSPHDRRLYLRATIDRNTKKADVFFVSLAQDRSAGRFNSRLYAAWTASYKKKNGDASKIELAVSDDAGIHWSSRTVLSSLGIYSPRLCRGKSVFGEVHLAVNPEGVLGILWAENERNLLFASSRDGGRTFAPSAVVAGYRRAPAMRIEEVWPSDYYWQATVLAYQAGKTDVYRDWEVSPGFAVVLTAGNLDSADSALVADASGTFHAFWSQPREDVSENALYTRSIVAATSDGSGRPLLHDPTSSNSCMFLTEQQVHPSLPVPQPKFTALPGEREITKSIAVNPLHYHYDVTSHTIDVDVEFVNTGKTMVRGPLRVVGITPHSDFGVPVSLNPSESIGGQPVWEARVPSGGLPPQGHGGAMHFAFRVKSFRIPPSLFYTTGDGVALKLRIFEPLQYPGR